MPFKETGRLSPESSGGYPHSNMTSFSGARAGTSLHGKVNVLLSGAMLSGLIMLVFIICYCCHRNMHKQNRNAQYWQEETDVPLEIFTVDGQCYEVAGVLVSSESCSSVDTTTSCPTPDTPSPPPAYDTVVIQDKKNTDKEDNSGLPSYEAALKLEAQGYV